MVQKSCRHGIDYLFTLSFFVIDRYTHSEKNTVLFISIKFLICIFQGNPIGLSGLGLMYMLGKGVEKVKIQTLNM